MLRRLGYTRLRVLPRREERHLRTMGASRGDQGRTAVYEEADQGQQDDPHQKRGLETLPGHILRQRLCGRRLDKSKHHDPYHRSRAKFSTSTDSRWRKIDMMIASPTAASAAATATTKNTKTWPLIPA